MIVNNEFHLNYYKELCININKIITKQYHKIIKDSIESAFSSSIYINDIYLDAVTITYNIIKNHYFKDGNKRTAFILLKGMSNLYDLNLIEDDDLMKELMMDLTLDNITKEEFIKYAFEI